MPFVNRYSNPIRTVVLLRVSSRGGKTVFEVGLGLGYWREGRGNAAAN